MVELTLAATPAAEASAAIAAGLSTGGLNLALHAASIAPEGAVLIALLICLLVDLAGEKVASRWVPPICYGGLGAALVLLALQWNATPESAFLGAFLADNLSIAFRAVVAASRIAAYSPRGVPLRST